jgi:phosphatidylserine synthase 2
MVRPHPALWRLVHGCAVLYVLALVWLLFQSVHEARQALKVCVLGGLVMGGGCQAMTVLALAAATGCIYARSLQTCLPPTAPQPDKQVLDPSLGVEVAYRDYGTSCQLLLRRAAQETGGPSSSGVSSSNSRNSLLSSLMNPPFTLNWPVLRATLFDEFVVAHSLGWWAKALLLRNSGLLWVASIGFELLEASFAVSEGGQCDCQGRAGFRRQRLEVPVPGRVIKRRPLLEVRHPAAGGGGGVVCPAAHAAQLQRVLVGQLAAGRCHLQLPG